MTRQYYVLRYQNGCGEEWGVVYASSSDNFETLHEYPGMPLFQDRRLAEAMIMGLVVQNEHRQ